MSKTRTSHLQPTNRWDLVCIGSASPAIIFLNNHPGHQYRHKSAHTIPANTRQPILNSGHNVLASRIYSGATEHGVLQTRSRQSRRAITWPLATSVMNVNTSSPQFRRTRTPLNHGEKASEVVARRHLYQLSATVSFIAFILIRYIFFGAKVSLLFD